MNLCGLARQKEKGTGRRGGGGRMHLHLFISFNLSQELFANTSKFLSFLFFILACFAFGSRLLDLLIVAFAFFCSKKNLIHFSICACHPCAGAMLIFSVSFQV